MGFFKKGTEVEFARSDGEQIAKLLGGLGVGVRIANVVNPYADTMRLIIDAPAEGVCEFLKRVDLKKGDEPEKKEG